MTASRLAAALAAGTLLSLAVPAAGWADTVRCADTAACVAAAEADGRDRPLSDTSTSQQPSTARITGPLASLPGTDETSARGDATVLRAATLLIALGIVAATAGLSLALHGRRPGSSG